MALPLLSMMNLGYLILRSLKGVSKDVLALSALRLTKVKSFAVLQEHYGQFGMVSAPVDKPLRYRPRRWWVASLFSFLGFGLGYIYVGALRRALMAAIVSALTYISLWTGLGGALASPVGFALFIAALIVPCILIPIDAALLASKRPNFELQPYNRWWVYAGAIVASMSFGSLDLLPKTGISSAIRPFSMPASAMVPTLQVGELAQGYMRAYKSKNPELGDVAVFVGKRHSGAEFVSRIVGLPSDRVQMKEGTLHINGNAVREVKLDDVELEIGGGQKSKAVEWRETLPNGRSYLIAKINNGQGPFNNTGEFAVPDDHYFMMGDNRDNALDSRDAAYMGFIPRHALRGRMAFIFWPKTWNRMGKVVK